MLVYEALGQGPPPPSEVCSIDRGDGSKREVTLEQYYEDVSLERQGRDFWEVVDEAFYSPDSYHYGDCDGDIISEKKVDVAGFSFGGRVAMAAASLEPNRIRRLHLTGVGAERDEYATVVLTSWKEILRVKPANGAGSNDDYGDENNQYYGEEGYIEDDDNEECDPETHASRCTSHLRAFAWSIILATYSEHFLASAGPKRVQTWVDGVCRYNTEEGLKALLMQTHGDFLGDQSYENVPNGQSTHASVEGDNTDLWVPAAIAQRIKASQAIESCKILVGSQDKMASPIQAHRLAELLGLQHVSYEGGDEIAYKGGHEQGHFEYDAGIKCSFKVIQGCGHAVPMEALRSWREDVLAFLNE